MCLFWSYTAQLQIVQEDMETLREQRDSALFSMRQEVRTAQEEAQSLRKTLEASGAQREREISTLKGNLETVSSELEKWRQAAAKYEREMDSLQASHQQQNQQKDKAAKQQGVHTPLPSLIPFTLRKHGIAALLSTHQGKQFGRSGYLMARNT